MRTVLKNNPDRREPTIIMRADRAREAGQWGMAAELYRIALARNPEKARIWVQYGHALKEADKLLDAEAAYRTAIQYEEQLADAYLQLGHVLKLQNKIAEAKAAYLQALKLDSLLADAAHELRGLGWTGVDPSQSSRSVLSNSRKAGGQNAWTKLTGWPRGAGAKRSRSFIARADQARDAREWKSAADLYCKALDRNPQNASIWVQYGHALKESGMLTEAEAAYREALRYEPGVADTHHQLGHVLKLQGKQDEAQAAYLHAFALDCTLRDSLHELRGLGLSENYLKELSNICAATLSARPKPYESVRAIADAEIICVKTPRFGQEIALFASYAPNGKVKAHIPAYLNSIKRQNIDVVVVVNVDAPAAFCGGDILEPIADGLFVRQAIGFDFAAWAHILHLRSDLLEAETVYFLNDSVIGPFNDVLFGNLLQKVRENSADLVGVTESLERAWHLQSYFLVAKSNALSSGAFRRFFSSVVAFPNKDDVIEQYELQLGQKMKDAGLKCGAIFPATEFRNPTQYRWRELIELGFPFIKVETAAEVVPDLDSGDWRDVVAAHGYDVRLAEQAIEQRWPLPANSSKSMRSRVEATGLFSPEVYLALNEDVATARADPWVHFLEHGLNEGRQFTQPEHVARVLSKLNLDVRAARRRYTESEPRCNSRIATRFREANVRIGVYCSSEGNFYMRDFADLLVLGLRAEGIDAIRADEKSDKNELFHARIFVAPHEFFTLGDGVSWISLITKPSTVLFNVEQVQSPWFCRTFEFLLKAPLILDLNFQSAEIFRRAGCKVVHFVPGYLPDTPYTSPILDMTRIKLVAGYAWSREKFNWLEEGGLNDRPIDLLFIGTAAARRDNAFRRLRELSDRYRFLCIYKRANQPLTERNYGSASTEIACALGQRSKIVLNLHRDWLGYFEWSRIVLQGIWQGACVVSDPGLPSPTFESGTHYLEENVQHMTELVNWLLGSKEGREKMELTRTAGYKHATESVSMSVTLSPVLEALEASLLGGRS